eukprot:scaffold12257_cov141-Isochrysis_galbana.AAC.4
MAAETVGLPGWMRPPAGWHGLPWCSCACFAERQTWAGIEHLHISRGEVARSPARSLNRWQGARRRRISRRDLHGGHFHHRPEASHFVAGVARRELHDARQGIGRLHAEARRKLRAAREAAQLNARCVGNRWHISLRRTISLKAEANADADRQAGYHQQNDCDNGDAVLGCRRQKHRWLFHLRNHLMCIRGALNVLGACSHR